MARDKSEKRWNCKKIKNKSPTLIQSHLFSLTACHISINNSPSTVGCLCASAAVTELSVTGTGCSSLCSVWASCDSHVKPSQIFVTRCRAEDMGNHSNDVAAAALTGAQLKCKHSRLQYNLMQRKTELFLNLFCLQ